MIKGNAKINRPRNRFNMGHSVKTTFNPAKVIPLAWYEILPGDTAEMKCSFILRSLTPLNPVMDDATLDVKAVFCPLEILWDKALQFFGQDEPGLFSPIEVTMPFFQADQSDLKPAPGVGSIGDYLELPVENLGTLKLSTLPLRAYLATWNYWYRDENLYASVLYPIDGGSVSDVQTSYSVWYSDEPLPSMKLPDYFTTCMPYTSKISPVEFGGDSPVVAGADHISAGDNADDNPNLARLAKFASVNVANANTVYENTYLALNDGTDPDAQNPIVSIDPAYALTPANLWAKNASLNVELFRRAIVYQHIGEIMMRAGSRYASEFLPAIFGVENSDSLLNQPELLGGFERHINMTEVLSNADTGESGRILGDNGAMSKTTGANDYLFQHTFTRHGIVLVLATVRHTESYSQGLPRKFRKFSFFDHYLPQAQGLGYQKVFKSELYASSIEADADEVFGYQDYGAEYRYQPNRLAGYMRPYVTGGLSTWTWSQVFAAAPTLSANFIKADDTGFARTSALSNADGTLPENTHYYFGDFRFDGVWTRVVGVQRFPGLNYI